ncbi:MAG: hypothetical protein HN732_08290 [Rhodospirillaceae bacterium]|nr:hypothetical protein [Rhodospirillaceae bacterium]
MQAANLPNIHFIPGIVTGCGKAAARLLIKPDDLPSQGALDDDGGALIKFGGGTMPTELRKIIFSHRELLEAFEDRPPNLPGNSEVVPPGTVRGVHGFQKFGGGVKVLLDIEDAKEGRLKRFNLNAEFISEVLLHYCAGLNIPVAKEAVKYLEVIGDNLALSQKIRAQEIFAEQAAGPPLDY